MLRSAVAFLTAGMALALVGIIDADGYHASVASTLSIVCFVVFAALLALVILADIAETRAAVRQDRPSATRDRVGRSYEMGRRLSQDRP